MFIKLICVGKIKEAYLKDAIEEYSKRISKFAKLNIIEVKDEKPPQNASESEFEIVKDKEFKEILKYISSNDYVIYFDLNGKEYDSPSLAKHVDDLISQGKNLTFIIGGSYGFSKNYNSIKNEKIKLSNLTFPHQLARVIVLEQLYRCFKINNNESYHK
ncbi:MAG: 23S rRNA (pseudouridine(1915)-N(3))-methyltransferase RlmH [Firmicutes bacterium]|nr:23S rRNA (pseudouridine(1915)-N(3))-methyltransferase RlmH [Candidatus Alectryobacillus merdavium]